MCSSMPWPAASARRTAPAASTPSGPPPRAAVRAAGPGRQPPGTPDAPYRRHPAPPFGIRRCDEMRRMTCHPGWRPLPRPPGVPAASVPSQAGGFWPEKSSETAARYVNHPALPRVNFSEARRERGAGPHHFPPTWCRQRATSAGFACGFCMRRAGGTADPRDCGPQRLRTPETADPRDCGPQRLRTPETADPRDCGPQRLRTPETAEPNRCLRARPGSPQAPVSPSRRASGSPGR
jgi:hypothetical protein